MAIDLSDLKDAIRKIAQEEPEFLTELVGEIIQENLHIKERDRDFYENRDVPVSHRLAWGADSKNAREFSQA